MSSFITICRHRLKNLQRAWLVADLAILAPALASCSHSARVCACVSFFCMYMVVPFGWLDRISMPTHNLKVFWTSQTSFHSN